MALEGHEHPCFLFPLASNEGSKLKEKQSCFTFGLAVHSTLPLFRLALPVLLNTLVMVKDATDDVTGHHLQLFEERV